MDNLSFIRSDHGTGHGLYRRARVGRGGDGGHWR